MKKLLFFLLLHMPLHAAFSQAFEWVQAEKVGYALNPSYPEFPLAFDEVNRQVISARLDSVFMTYGTHVYGNGFIESRDTLGGMLWQVPLSDHCFVQRIAADPSGNIYVAGQFMQTLYIGTSDSLTQSGGPVLFGLNAFMLKFDGQGNLLWKRNISADWPDYERIEAIAIDPSGNCWFAMTDFFIAKIVQMDPSGVDQVIHTITNGKAIGNISFDPGGGMYVSGACEWGNFIMNSDTFQVLNQYNMFLARFDAAGSPAWAHFAADITFQRPMVVADKDGNAFMSGYIFDSTSFNGYFFHNPVLVGDFFALQADASGTIQWGLQQPQLLIGPFGSFEPGTNLMIATDSSGLYYLGGVQRGPVDWGNGYVSVTANNERKIAVACMDASGSVKWVKIGGGTMTNTQHAIAVSPSGSCYFSGSFSDNAVFDSITFANGNFYNFTIGKISNQLTGIDEPGELQVSIYPNPSAGIIHMPSQLLNSELTAYDMSGRVVLKKLIEGQFLDLSELTDQVYMLTFLSNKKIYRSRFVKI